jgi:hypothetical protein
MPKIAYIEKRVREDTLALIQWADRTATDYARRGFSLTLRQLYYQGVTQNLYPNSERSYKRLGNVVSDGRLLGLIDWNHLTDRHRETSGTGWETMDTLPEMADLIHGIENRVAHDLWAGQDFRPEIWVEKDALEQVAQKAASGYRIPYFACKGYVSSSAMWEAGYGRFGRYMAMGQTPVIIHLGDHDPSGIDMTRDIEDRLALFAGSGIEVKRIALNFDQIEAFNPPPNPAKVTDSRFESYERRFGDESWELDALAPELLVQLARETVQSLIDPEIWAARVDEEEEATEKVREVADRWEEIEEWLEENPR